MHNSFAHPNHHGTDCKRACASLKGLHVHMHIYQNYIALGTSFIQVQSQHEKVNFAGSWKTLQNKVEYGTAIKSKAG